MIRKAALQARVAAEQKAIARIGVKQAQAQVASVQAAIQATQDQIADNDGFFTQVCDFFEAPGHWLAPTRACLTSATRPRRLGWKVSASLATAHSQAWVRWAAWVRASTRLYEHERDERPG